VPRRTSVKKWARLDSWLRSARLTQSLGGRSNEARFRSAAQISGQISATSLPVDRRDAALLPFGYTTDQVVERLEQP
jgi:hypothetical protein